MKNNSLGTKILMALIMMAALAYFGVQAFLYFSDPLTTTLAYSYQVEEGSDLSGYVVRREQVLTDDANGLIQIQKAEGERVSVGGVIATAYADQASFDRQNEINAMTAQIEQLQYAAGGGAGGRSIPEAGRADHAEPAELPAGSGGGQAGLGGKAGR